MKSQNALGAPFWTLLVAGVVICWRLLAKPADSLWHDWLLILSVYAVYTVFASRSRAWPAVTVATIAYLLGFYVVGQLPYLLTVFGLRE